MTSWPQRRLGGIALPFFLNATFSPGVIGPGSPSPLDLASWRRRAARPRSAVAGASASKLAGAVLLNTGPRDRFLLFTYISVVLSLRLLEHEPGRAVWSVTEEGCAETCVRKGHGNTASREG